jgi:hypothetical protein
MNVRKFLVLSALSMLCFGTGKTQAAATQDTTGKRPDFTKMSFEDIKWTKAEGSSFWFYYKPTQYFFKDKEFVTIPLQSGDFLVYIHEFDKYVLLPAYQNAKPNVEQAVELAALRPAVFIRLNRSRFVIFDRGQYVYNLERIGINTDHQVVYRSGISDKRYWIDEKDFSYGPMSVPIGIVSE